MSEPVRLTVVFQDGGDGWIMASIPELPGVVSQGRTKEEARFMVRDALREMILANLDAGEPSPIPAGTDAESLELIIAP